MSTNIVSQYAKNRATNLHIIRLAHLFDVSPTVRGLAFLIAHDNGTFAAARFMLRMAIRQRLNRRRQNSHRAVIVGKQGQEREQCGALNPNRLNNGELVLIAIIVLGFALAFGISPLVQAVAR